MSRTLRAWGPIAVSASTLGILVWRLGTGPFLVGISKIDGQALAAGAGLVALTTVCYAWRWKTVARGLGLELSLPDAVAAYYRSLFLNVTLPGGIVGDVHRGVKHGRDVGDLGRALRAVGWERAIGQAVQGVLTVVVLLTLPSPVQSSMPLVTIALVVATIGLVLVARTRAAGGRSVPARIRRTVARDIRDIRHGLLARRSWLGIALASALVVGGHVVTFLIAARTAGVTAPASRMLPIALLVMLAMVLPGLGAWGPREGAAAWVFGAAGLGAQGGVAAGVVYGVMVFVASLPGAVVLVVAWLRRSRPPRRTELPLPEATARA
jgi:glycosyltransferase 2 family protein